MVRRKHIRSLVEKLLAEYRVRKAPIPVAEIAEAQGADVRTEPADDDLSGFLYREPKSKRAVIGINANHHPNRRNFTTAHELAHLLLHDFDDVHVDRKFKVWLRDEESTKGTNVEEKEANLFAAELLMPARFIRSDVEEIGTLDFDDVDTLQELADRYGVSTQAMTFRLAYLGYLQH